MVIALCGDHISALHSFAGVCTTPDLNGYGGIIKAFPGNGRTSSQIWNTIMA
jgi:hypothetical protein